MAFFRRDIERLEDWEVEYAIKVPFYQWLDLQASLLNTTSGHPLLSESITSRLGYGSTRGSADYPSPCIESRRTA